MKFLKLHFSVCIIFMKTDMRYFEILKLPQSYLQMQLSVNWIKFLAVNTCGYQAADLIQGWFFFFVTYLFVCLIKKLKCK